MTEPDARTRAALAIERANQALAAFRARPGTPDPEELARVWAEQILAPLELRPDEVGSAEATRILTEARAMVLALVARERENLGGAGPEPSTVPAAPAPPVAGQPPWRAYQLVLAAALVVVIGIWLMAR